MQNVLPLPPLFNRVEPYFKFIDCIEITARERKKILDRFGDTHDGPLVPGMVFSLPFCIDIVSLGFRVFSLVFCIEMVSL